MTHPYIGLKAEVVYPTPETDRNWIGTVVGIGFSGGGFSAMLLLDTGSHRDAPMEYLRFGPEEMRIINDRWPLAAQQRIASISHEKKRRG